jgi:fucose 4-O-acetylase-like acetyltransferase
MRIQPTKNWLDRAFNTSVLDKKRLEWVDYLRGIAIVLVVYRHALLGIERSNVVVPHFLNDANMIFYSFRMPLFFLLSGIFISRSLAKRTFSQLLGIKFEKLLYPYLVWITIQITMQIILSGITNSKRSLIDYTYIFYQPRHLDQFWYLAALFNATILFVFLKTKLRVSTTMQIVIGLAFYAMFPYFQGISMLSDFMEFYIFFAMGDALAQFFFRPSTQLFFKNPLSLILIIPGFIMSQLFYLNYVITHNLDTDNKHELSSAFLNNVGYQGMFLVIAVIGCLSMIILAFRLQSLKLLPFLRILGYHSLYIYVMHVIVTAFVRITFMKAFGLTNPFVLLFVTIALGVTIPIAIYNLLIRNNVGWFLFSYHKKKTPEPVAVTEKRQEVVTSQQED